MGRYRDLLQDLATPTTELAHAVPEAWAGFRALHKGAMADGEVPARLKEAVALAIGVVQHCDGCIAYHAKAAARAGATEAEVAEILAVAVLMESGPATVYAPRAWEAFKEFSDRTSAS